VGKAYVTDHILDETINILKYRISPDISIEFLNAFIFFKTLEIIVSSRELIESAMKLYIENYNVRGFSFTDALSIVTIYSFDLNYMLTFDRALGKICKNNWARLHKYVNEKRITAAQKDL